MREAYVDHLRELAARGQAPHVLVLSGDVAEYGADEQYEEAKRWIGASWELSDKGKRARYYRLTALGRKQLASEQSKWQAFARAVGLILKPVDQEGQ